MPRMFQPSQADVRKFFCAVFAKWQTAQTMDALETLASQWVAEHPEYHADFANEATALEKMYDVEDGKTYIVLSREEGIVYKRMYRTGNVTFEMRSDNKVYSPYELHAKDILEIWEFVCCLKTSDKKEEEINMESMMSFLRSMKVDIERIKNE